MTSHFVVLSPIAPLLVSGSECDMVAWLASTHRRVPQCHGQASGVLRMGALLCLGTWPAIFNGLERKGRHPVHTFLVRYRPGPL